MTLTAIYPQPYKKTYNSYLLYCLVIYGFFAWSLCLDVNATDSRQNNVSYSGQVDNVINVSSSPLVGHSGTLKETESAIAAEANNAAADGSWKANNKRNTTTLAPMIGAAPRQNSPNWNRDAYRSPNSVPSREPNFNTRDVPSDALHVFDSVASLWPQHPVLGAPKPGEWRYLFPEEDETFFAYVRSNPVRAGTYRDVFYLLPIGKFTSEQTSIFERVGQYMCLSSGLKVRVLDPIPVERLTPECFIDYRSNSKILTRNRQRQISAPGLIRHALEPLLPIDAAALLAITAVDITDDNRPFVLGMGSLERRCGVMSLVRLGDPERNYKYVLQQALKLSQHESGHLFSLPHCVNWSCVMNGVSSLDEMEALPLAFCPSCQAKWLWGTRMNTAELRLTRLKLFLQRENLPQEAKFIEASLSLLHNH